jgi:hypothetical protein
MPWPTWGTGVRGLLGSGKLMPCVVWTIETERRFGVVSMVGVGYCHCSGLANRGGCLRGVQYAPYERAAVEVSAT